MPAGSRRVIEPAVIEEAVVSETDTTDLFRNEPPPVLDEVDLIGVRGVDFVGIWHSPESPNEMIRYDMARDGYLRFRNALLVTRDEEEQAVVELAAQRGHYIPADPEQRKPLVCQMCSWPFYSIDAFTKHTKFSHMSGMTRK